MCTDRAARLQFIRLNQDKLRADLYRGLADAAIHGADLHDVGRPTILPSTFIGGPRQMWKLYHDAMAIVRYCDKPDLFITMTCNPQWIELLDCSVSRSNGAGQARLDRTSVQAEVGCFTQDLIDHEAFGKVAGYLYTIEFQKRGLPHAHILLILDHDSKPRTPKSSIAWSVRKFRTKFCSLNFMRPLFSCVFHGPCGKFRPTAPCMIDGKCSKKYPKAYNDETSADQNCNLTYR